MIRPCESPVDLRCCLGAHLLQELWIWGPRVLFPVSTYSAVLSLARASVSQGCLWTTRIYTHVMSL